MGPDQKGAPPDAPGLGASQRRRLLLGPLAIWAASVTVPLYGASGRTVEATQDKPGRTVGREGKTITPPVSATIVREIHFDRPGRVADHMAWSADGERIAVGGAMDLRMSVLDVQTKRQLAAPGEQFGGVKGLAYSPDGRYLAVIRGGTNRKADPSSPRYTVSLWDARTSGHVGEVTESDSAVVENIQAHALSFSYDGRYLAIAYLKQTAVYALPGGGGIQRVLLLPAASRCAFRPDAAVLACLSLGLGVRRLGLYRVPDGQVIAQLDLRATNLGWSSDGHLLATTNGSQINLHDMRTNSRDRDLTVADPDARFQSVSFSPDGRLFIGASDRRVDLWETASWTHVTTLGHQKNLVSAALFAPRESQLGIVGYAPATIWNVRLR